MPVEVTYQPGKVTVKFEVEDLEHGRFDGYLFGGGLCGVSGGWWKPQDGSGCGASDLPRDLSESSGVGSAGRCIEFPGYGVYKESVGVSAGWASVAAVDCAESDAGGCGVVGESNGSFVDRGRGGCEPGAVASAVVSKTRGKWYYHNKAKRERRRRERSGNGQADGLGRVDVPVAGVGGEAVRESKLQVSLQEKWQAENELRKFEAERKLRLLKEQDESTLVRMQRAQVMRTTETCKVQTEKAFASLKKSGDVVGFAETVVSDPSLTEGSSARSSGDCISPDSSVSQQEIRRMQQENLEMQRALEKVRENDPKLHAFAMKMGGLKTAFTLDTNGDIPVDEEGEIGPDGKFHMMYPRANVTTIKQQNAMDREYNEYLNGFDY